MSRRQSPLKKGSFFVDLARQTVWNDDDFYDFIHMTPKGTKKVGTLLYETLKTIIPSIVTESRS